MTQIAIPMTAGTDLTLMKRGVLWSLQESLLKQPAAQPYMVFLVFGDHFTLLQHGQSVLNSEQLAGMLRMTVDASGCDAVIEVRLDTSEPAASFPGAPLQEPGPVIRMKISTRRGFVQESIVPALIGSGSLMLDVASEIVLDEGFDACDGNGWFAKRVPASLDTDDVRRYVRSLAVQIRNLPKLDLAVADTRAPIRH